MKISIITPTKNRSDYLKLLYSNLTNQTYQDWEWLILDTSTCPLFFNDPRVHYSHLREEITIGAKRNCLTRAAKGDVIVQCDDDDYYYNY